MTRLSLLLVWLVCHCLSLLPLQTAHAQKTTPKSKQTKVNVLAIAAVLIRDGHAERARIILNQFKTNPKDKPSKQKAQKAQYHMLLGIIYTKKGLSKSAVRHYEQAVQHGLRKPLLFVFLAQGYFRLARYQKALTALARAPKEAETIPGVFLLKAQSLWRLKRHTEAYTVLQKGRKQHPTVKAMLRLQVLLLIELKLSREAKRAFRTYIQERQTETRTAIAKQTTPSADPKAKSPLHTLLDTYLMFAGAFHRQQLLPSAILVLEEAMLWSPENPVILLQLARLYMESKQPRTAAELLERAARSQPKLMVEAAELYRRAGMFWRALYLNAQVVNQKAKIKQRLGLLIERKRFEEAAALAPRLSRLGLLRNQQLLYALAFACYKTGRYRDANKWLGRISDRDLFRKAIFLRKAIQSCAKRQWWCP